MFNSYVSLPEGNKISKRPIIQIVKIIKLLVDIQNHYTFLLFNTTMEHCPLVDEKHDDLPIKNGDVL